MNKLKTLEKCIECGKCEKNCLLLKKFIKSPKNLLDYKKIDPQLIFSCNLCNYCQSVCPQNINLKDIFLSLKKDLLKDPKIKKNINFKSIDIFQKTTTSKILTAKSKHKKNPKRIFFPGCSFSHSSPLTVLKIHKWLSILENTKLYLQCCNAPYYGVGSDKFEKSIKKLEKNLYKNHVEEIIVACPNCYRTLKENTSFKIISIWSILKENINSLNYNLNSYSKDYFLHDSCTVRNYPSYFKDVRAVLNSLNISYREFKNNKENTLCCGSGAMVKVINPNFAKKLQDNRKTSLNNESILCYCEECRNALSDKNTKCYNLLDIIFFKKSSEIYNSFTLWKNRFYLSHEIRYMHLK